MQSRPRRPGGVGRAAAYGQAAGRIYAAPTWQQWFFGISLPAEKGMHELSNRTCLFILYSFPQQEQHNAGKDKFQAQHAELFPRLYNVNGGEVTAKKL